MGKTVRTFISIDIPVTDEIKGVLQSLKGVRNVRPVPISQIHITLRFLGDTDERRIPALCDGLKDAFDGFGPIDLVMKGMGAFPNLKNPRVVWIGFEDSARLMEAADVVTGILDSSGLDYDRKRFSPHVTVGRVNGKADIGDMISSKKEKEFCRFTCTEIKVMGSELTPKGAIHTVLGRVSL